MAPRKSSSGKKRARDDAVVVDDDDDDTTAATAMVTTTSSSTCPYLDTINCDTLDNFDFEKRCSISLSEVHVYGCLVCGKYFAGRGKSTHAYAHSLERAHHVFVHLATGKVYCLPDSYEVTQRDVTLTRIRDVLKPQFDERVVRALETDGPQWRRALDGSEYLVGVTGLNSLNKHTDYVNATLQALSRVKPLRRALLLTPNSTAEKPSLWERLSEITKKMWNARNFKGHSSPHEFMQCVRSCSNDAFNVDQTGDAAAFMRWLLNELLMMEKKKKKKKKKKVKTENDASYGDADVVADCFQGQVEIIDGDNSRTTTSPFLMLSLDLPPAPLFQDVMEKKIIPQVSLEHSLLKKFDGAKADPKTQRRFKITKLPQYLIVNYSRFTKNNFFTEKNPTIVTFPVKNLNLADHIPIPDAELRGGGAKYDLIANVVHDGTPTVGSYRAMVRHDADGNWYETQDLNVTEVLPQQVNLTETYVQIYERQRQQRQQQQQ
jgi:U4/U6.U5 tri-snRNP-associated protein 2